MAGLRVLLHVCPRMGNGVCRPNDCGRPGRMIPIHATATADPQQLRWVVAADRLPAAGVIDGMEVRTADVLITLSAGNGWRELGDDVREALNDALLDPAGWRIDASD